MKNNVLKKINMKLGTRVKFKYGDNVVVGKLIDVKDKVYDYLETNNITKIKLKDVALKVFNLSSKELNMSIQHRLGSILRSLSYSKNTKTKEWVKVKTGDTEDTTTLEAIHSKDLEGISNVSPITTREDTKDTKTIELENKLTETTEFAIRLNKEKQELLKLVKDLEAQLQEFKNKATPVQTKVASGTPLDFLSND